MNDALQIAAAPATYVPGTTAAPARSNAGGTEAASFAGLLEQAGVGQQHAEASQSNVSQQGYGASQGTSVHGIGQSTQQPAGTVASPASGEIVTAFAPGPSGSMAELQVATATAATPSQRTSIQAPTTVPVLPATVTAEAEPQPSAALAGKSTQSSATTSTPGGKDPASLSRATGETSTTAGTGKRKSLLHTADAAEPTTTPFATTLSDPPIPLADASGATVSVISSPAPTTIPAPVVVASSSTVTTSVSPVTLTVAPASPRQTAALPPAVQPEPEDASDGQTALSAAAAALPATLAGMTPQQTAGGATRAERSMQGVPRALEVAKDPTPDAVSLQSGQGAGSAITDGVPVEFLEGARNAAGPLSAAQSTAASPVPSPAPAVSSPATAPSAALEASSVAVPDTTAAAAPNARTSGLNAHVAGKQGTSDGGTRKSAADTSDTLDAATQTAFASTVPAAHAAAATTHGSAAIAAVASATGSMPVDGGVSFAAGHMAATGQPHTLGAVAVATLDSGLDASPVPTPARAGALEVGFHDTTLGWLSVRASVDASGDLHAALATHNPAAASAVSSLLPSLGRFLQDQNVSIQSVSSSAQMASGVAKDAAAQAGGAGSSSLGQGTPQGQSQGQAHYGAGQQGGATSNRQGSARDARTEMTWAVADDRRRSTSSLDARAGTSNNFAAADRTSTVSVRI